MFILNKIHQFKVFLVCLFLDKFVVKNYGVVKFGRLARRYEFNEQFMEKYWKSIPWEFYVKKHMIPDKILEKYCVFYNRLLWDDILLHHKLPFEQILKYNQFFDKDTVVMTQDNIPISYIEENLNNISKDTLSVYANLNEDFISKYADKLNWYYISQKPYLTNAFVKKHKKYINWNQFVMHHKLSDIFMIEMQEYIDFSVAIKYQIIPESLIRKYADKIDWYYVYRQRKYLSEGFINEFSYKMIHYKPGE